MKEHLDRETQNSNYWKEKYLEMQSSTLIPNLTQDKKKKVLYQIHSQTILQNQRKISKIKKKTYLKRLLK